MLNVVYALLSGGIGYIFGSIPFGYLLVKFTREVDLRDIGSGRTGGTNSFRAGGPVVGVITAVTDVLKAACAVWLVRALFAENFIAARFPWVEVFTGIMSVVGHNWSVFLGWRGGAGTGPNVGWAAAIWLPVVPIAIVVVLGTILILGFASVASLAMAAIIPISFAALYFLGVAPYEVTPAYIAGGIIAASIVVWSLRPNIKRLVAGNERIVGPRARRIRKREGKDSG